MVLSQLFSVSPCVLFFVCLFIFISLAGSQDAFSVKENWNGVEIDSDSQRTPEQSGTVSEQRSSNVDSMYKAPSSHPTPYILRTKIRDALLRNYSWSKKREHVEKRESNSTAIDPPADPRHNISHQQHTNRSSSNVKGERQVVPTQHEHSQDPSLRIFLISSSIVIVVGCVGITLLVLVLCHYRHVCRR